AKADGVYFEWFVQPVRVLGDSGHASGVEFVRTRLSDPSSRQSPVEPIVGSNLVLSADMVVKALGQEPLLELLRAVPGLQIKGGKVVADRASGATSIPRLFAGGDCIRGGGEIVDAVQDGKIAAAGIDAMLKTN